MTDKENTPYGTAEVDNHSYPSIDRVIDLNYAEPEKIERLCRFIENTSKIVPGKTVVVSHGPELRLFAKENYKKYQAIVDQLADLTGRGVEFRMCANSMKRAGFEATDMHGFITIIPAGFAEIILLQSQGYQYINPIPHDPKDVRYLDHPDLKRKK
ncbi:MAG: DsrE family protein [Rhodospirillales bacterium]|nr:DsrE family protein [Rhodospirillales bacterium]